MAFCKSCGGQLPEGAHNCPNCGAPVIPDVINAGTGAQNGGQTYNSYAGTSSVRDHTAEFDYQDLTTNKWVYILAYIGILFFLPLVAYPNSRVGKFHSNQALIMLIFGFATTAINRILSIFSGISYVGWVFSLLAVLVSSAAGIIELAVFIYQAVNISNNKAVEIPVIGKFTLIK